MANYDERPAALRRLERILREKAFEDENKTVIGYPQEWAEKDRVPQNCAAMSEVDGCGIVSVWISGGNYGVFYSLTDGSELKPIPDTDLTRLLGFDWICQDPLPPLVVLAKCADGVLPTDKWGD